MMPGEHGLHLSNQDANIASDITCHMMRSQSGMIPFYREAIGNVIVSHYLTENYGLGAFIRQEFNLWDRCKETATDVSQEVVRRVWRRLA